MPRRKLDQMGIRFGITVNSGGYAWREVPVDPLNPQRLGQAAPMTEPLAIVPMEYKGDVIGLPQWSDPPRVRRSLGLRDAWDAFRGFRGLAEKLEHTAPDEQARALILEYANKYGLLWGSERNQTLGRWRTEARELLDLDDLAQMIATSKLAGFSDRLSTNNIHTWYTTPRGNNMLVVTEGESVDFHVTPKALANTVDYASWIAEHGARQQAWWVLATALNRKLRGGLSLSLDPLDERNRRSVSPRYLIHVLYLRLWIDAVTPDGIDEHPASCKYCGEEITSKGIGRPLECCSEDHRWKYNNRKRARSR